MSDETPTTNEPEIAEIRTLWIQRTLDTKGNPMTKMGGKIERPETSEFEAEEDEEMGKEDMITLLENALTALKPKSRIVLPKGVKL